MVVNRQASVAATRALLRQMSNCSSSATLVPSRQGSNASTIGVVRQMSQLNEFDENEIRNVLYQYKKKPGSNYVCHICHVREEHFIQDCPRVCICTFFQLPPTSKLTLSFLCSAMSAR